MVQKVMVEQSVEVWQSSNMSDTMYEMQNTSNRRTMDVKHLEVAHSNADVPFYQHDDYVNVTRLPYSWSLRRLLCLTVASRVFVSAVDRTVQW